MGWWDDIKGWGTDLYNGVATLPVRSYVGERFDDMQRLGTNLYNNATVYNVVVGTCSYTYKTIEGLFQQVATIPKFTHSVIFHQNTRMVARHVLRVAFEDLLPLVLVTYTNDMIQRHGRECLDDEENYAYLSMDMAVLTGLRLLNMATWVYSTRKKMQMTVRTTIMTIEAGRALNGVNNEPKMTLCKDEKCSTLRFVQGSIRDTAAFFATEAAISLISYPAGDFIAAVLSIHHRGRYIATVVLPDLCNRHQIEYLTEYPELASSLGSGHALLSLAAVKGIELSPALLSTLVSKLTPEIFSNLILKGMERIPFIPAIWYEAAVTQFMMFASISMAAHMPLPKPVAKSSRMMLDPVAGYQALIGFIFDTIALGLKLKIPRMLKLPPSNINWGDIANHAIEVWKHPYARPVEYILVPRMLRSKQAFTNDPVIAPNWAGFRETSIVAIGSIEDVKKHFLVKVGTLNPKLSAKTLAIFGAPKSVVEILLKLMGNETAMSALSRLRRKLEAMDGIGVGELPVNNRQTLEVRDERSLRPKALPEPVEKTVEDNQKLDPRTVIEPEPKSKPATITTAIAKTSPKKKLNPEDIINPRRGTFFSNPENIIRPRTNPTASEKKVEESLNGESTQTNPSLF